MKKQNKQFDYFMYGIIILGFFFLLFSSLYDGASNGRNYSYVLIIKIIGFFLSYLGALSYFCYYYKNNFRSSLSEINRVRNYVFGVIGLFVLSALIGYFFEISFVSEVISKMISELLEKTKDLGYFEMFWFIFLNNSNVGFFSILLGIFIGIFPLITSVFNGYIIGYVVNKAAQVSGFSTILKLAPHGIFELPAIFISIGLGIRLGFDLFRAKPYERFNQNIINSLRIFVFIIVPLLFVAAIIETILIFLIK